MYNKPLDAIVHLTVQKWDTDGQRVKLPKKVKVDVVIYPNDNLESIHDSAISAASDKHGWCIDSCTMDKIILPD